LSASVNSNAIVKKAISKVLASILSIQIAIEKSTTSLPQIYYRTLVTIITISDYSLYRAISVIKSVTINLSFLIKRFITVQKSGSVSMISIKQTLVSTIKYATISTIQTMKKQVSKIVRKSINVIGNILMKVPITGLVLYISDRIQQLTVYAKAKFINKSVTKIDNEVIPKYSNTTSYIKEKHKKTTIE